MKYVEDTVSKYVLFQCYGLFQFSSEEIHKYMESESDVRGINRTDVLLTCEISEEYLCKSQRFCTSFVMKETLGCD